MTKAEFISKIASSSGQTAKDVQSVLRHFQLVLLEELGREGKVNVLDLGQIKVSERAARQGINPRTGTKLQIAARKTPRLAPSRKFKDFVDGNGKIEEFNY